MAQRLLEHALKNEPPPLKSLQVRSAGVSAYPGDRASENAIIALKKVGIDLKDHESQPLSGELLSGALAVFCMTETHRQLINSRFSPAPSQVHLIREFLPAAQENEIPDPYGSDIRTYEACRDSIVEAIPSILRFLKTLV